MQEGNGDVTHQYLSDNTFSQMSGYDNVTVDSVTQLQSWSGTFNTNREPTDDLDVRKAFAHSFDYQGMLNNVFGGAEAAAGPVPKVLAAHNSDIEPYAQDAELAQSVLEESSYTAEEINDIGIELNYFAGFSLYENFSQILQQNLRNILDITSVEIEPVQVAQLFERLQSVDTMAHVVPVANTANIPTAYNYTYQMYHPSQFPEESGAVGYGNGARWTTPELTETLENIRAETNPEIRNELYADAQELIVEGYPSIFVANPPLRRAISDDINGYTFYGVQNYDINFHDWSPT